VKESKQISEIDPESAVEASGIDPAIEEGIVAFDHHKPSALEALHTCPTLSNRDVEKVCSRCSEAQRTARSTLHLYTPCGLAGQPF
jgi:hypothetical protein